MNSSPHACIVGALLTELFPTTNSCCPKCLFIYTFIFLVILSMYPRYLRSPSYKSLSVRQNIPTYACMKLGSCVCLHTRILLYIHACIHARAYTQLLFLSLCLILHLLYTHTATAAFKNTFTHLYLAQESMYHALEVNPQLISMPTQRVTGTCADIYRVGTYTPGSSQSFLYTCKHSQVPGHWVAGDMEKSVGQ